MENFNFVALDPSLISTALVVNNKIFNYCRESSALNKSGLSKWYKMAEQYASYKYIKYRKYNNYSEGELIKLMDYDSITDQIILDIELNIDKSIETKIGIEGYSFSSAAGDIIDLVTFSTLLRKKLFDQISNDILVMSPSTLKQESCKLTYQPKNIGKKKEILEWRNNSGIAGGKFTKIDMAVSLIENLNINDSWTNHLRSIKSELLSFKKIPKPHEDVNDAITIYHVLKSKK